MKISADLTAACIVAAARRFDVHPEYVFAPSVRSIEGLSRAEFFDISRARTYALLALHEILTEDGIEHRRAQVARLVHRGDEKNANWFSIWNATLAKGDAKFFNIQELAGVKADARAILAPQEGPEEMAPPNHLNALSELAKKAER